MDRGDATRGGFGATSRPAARITPDDVQRKEFGTARVRVGYLMHEVDEFLDEITDTLSSLLTENERLRAQLGASPAPRAATSSPPAVRPAVGADRAAGEAFLQQEKAFLQSLGALVQGHAEELKGMVRSVRETTGAAASPGAAPAAPEAATGPAATVVTTPADRESQPEPPAEAEADITSVPSVEEAPEPLGAIAPESSEGAIAPESSEGAIAPESSEGAIAPENPVDAAEPDGGDADDVDAILDGGDEDGDDAHTRVIETVGSEAPIVVEEPEPTGTRRREEPSEGSLRELFWGEE